MGRHTANDLLDDATARQHLINALVQIERRAKNSKRGSELGFPLPLKDCVAGSVNPTISDRSMRQSWKRWTLGKNLPSSSIAKRVLQQAEIRGWLKLEDLPRAERKTIQSLLWKQTGLTKPIRSPWTKARPLGCFQPSNPRERDRWQRDLQFATELGLEIGRRVRAEIGPHQLPLPGLASDQARWLAMFRAAFTELCAASLDELHRVPCNQQEHPYWPLTLRVTGDDICSMFYAVARSLDAQEDGQAVIDKSRASMLAHPEQDDAELDAHRVQNWLR